MDIGIKGAVRSVDAAAVLGLLPARPRLLALGEPTHGEDVLLELRNELFRQLVEHGYRTIAVESDCVAGLVVDDYVAAGVGTLDDVMERGFSHGFGRSPANRELVRWMRAYNDGRPGAERLRFAGFDGPLEMTGAASPRQALTALDDYLGADRAAALDRLIGDDERWTEPAAMMDPARSVGRTAEADELRLLADELVALLDVQASERVRMFGRTAVGLLRYHHWMADESPDRIAELVKTRAAMMTGNLLAVAERGPALVYAHNGHLQRSSDTSAGATVGAQLGDGYAFLPTAIGTIRHRGVDTPPPDTIEGLLYALPEDRYVVDARPLGDVTLAPRVSPWFGYAPLDPARINDCDGIVFVKDAPAGPTWWP
ncbi:erythromycin esterase family protein [Dactylosporangium darangshiense]|uniref:Erythromycin esterase n=1 Tax=Dactylosporangium darangshiense TaxID=579108 RepID=A0ABP8DGQ4_9ACTN